MIARKYALISMTVFGRKPNPLRIIQIAITKGTGITSTLVFNSNVNPEERLSEYLQNKIGLTDVELMKAPTFAQVAESLLALLKDCVLVGHNISFLHYALQSEFKYLGYSFNAPQLCTLRLSKKIIPDLISYELTYMCGVLSIPFHGDSNLVEENYAVSQLFGRLLDLDEDDKHISSLLLPDTTGTSRLPSRLGYHQFEELPTRPGIYTFQNDQREVIYVGKAKNIKKRVLSHFYSTSEKETALCNATVHVDFELTGSELIALLREADLIQKLKPLFNYIQKKEHTTYRIVPQKNRKGIVRLTIEKRPFQHVPTEIFLKRGQALGRLMELTKTFHLCPKYTGLQGGIGACSHIECNGCMGICKNGESVRAYNDRVALALEYLNNDIGHFVIFEKGRDVEERSFVLIKHGVYQGYGFLDNSISISRVEDFEILIQPKQHTYHSAKIIMGYRKRNPYKMKPIIAELLK